MKQATVHVHADRELMHDIGTGLGLSGDKLVIFRVTCSDVKLTLDVDETTGDALIIAVDDRQVVGD